MTDVPLADRDLAALVPEWLEWSEVAQLLGVTPGKVRTMIREHELAQAVSAPGVSHRPPGPLAGCLRAGVKYCVHEPLR